jgi:hypothetical protein
MPNHETYGLCVMRVTHYERKHDCTRMHGGLGRILSQLHTTKIILYAYFEKKKPREGPVYTFHSPPIAVFMSYELCHHHHLQTKPLAPCLEVSHGQKNTILVCGAVRL